MKPNETSSGSQMPQNSQSSGKEHRQYTEGGKHYTYEPTPEQLQAMRRNVEIARNVWMRMSPEERSAVMPGGPEGPKASPELTEARRQNIEIAREAWMNMSPEERSKRMPGGGDYKPEQGRHSKMKREGQT